jgi:hypothetical protein
MKRLSKHISKNRLACIADSLYISKIRYGLQLFGKVRLGNEDQKNSLLTSLQNTQNKYARLMDSKMPSAIIFNDLNQLSTKQINAQIKSTEVWKSFDIANYPLQWEKQNANSNVIMNILAKKLRATF